MSPILTSIVYMSSAMDSSLIPHRLFTSFVTSFGGARLFLTDAIIFENQKTFKPFRMMLPIL